jgi:hypothetical protein
VKPPRNPLLYGHEQPEAAPNPEGGIEVPTPPSSDQLGGAAAFLRNQAMQHDAGQEIRVNLEDIEGASVKLTHSSPRSRARKRKILLIRDNNAAEALADFDEDTDVVGLMTGRFGLIHMLRHLFRLTGPAHLTVSSWRLYAEDVDRVLRTLHAGRLLSARWLLDHTFQHRQPLEANQIREKFGRHALRVTRNHAKFLLLATPCRHWTITIKTSPNLNQNPRLEHWDITNDPALFDFLDRLCDGIFRQDDFSRARRFPRPRFFALLKQVDPYGKGEGDP